MALSRRDFVRRLGAGGAAVASATGIIGYGREELLAFDFQGQGAGRRQAQGGPAPIRLSSNENLRGPSAKVIEALKAAPSRDLGLGYPPPSVSSFQDAIAAMWGAKPNNVMMATGSGAELVAGVLAFCQTEKPLVTAHRRRPRNARNSRSSQSRSMATSTSISTSWSRPHRAPASCSCATRTTHRPPSISSLMSNRPCGGSRKGHRRPRS